MEIGDCFATLEEAEEKIISYMRDNFHPVRKIHSQSVKSYNKKVKTKFLPEDIQVYTITWVCKHTGIHRPRVSKGTRKRIVLALNCPFKLTLTYNLIRRLYVINYFTKTHNHAIGEELYKSYATSRRPDHATKSLMEQMLQIGGNTSLVTAFAHSKGAMVTPKDVMNMKQKIKIRRKAIEVDDVFENQILANTDLVYEVVKNKTQPSVIEAIFLSSKNHILLAKSFPDIMILDGTYRENKLLWPLYVLCTADEEMVGRPVAYCILPNLNGKLSEFLRWWKSKLRDAENHEQKLNINEIEYNPQCFFSERNIEEISLLKKEFPSTFVAVSRYNCISEVNSFLETSRLDEDISRSCLSHFEELLYSTTSDEFKNTLEKISNTSQLFFDYVKQEWMPYEKEFPGYARRWKLHLDFNHKYNCLENLHSIFKNVFDEEMTDAGFTTLISNVTELLKADPLEQNSIPEMADNVDECLVEYKKDFSVFAINEIIKEYEEMKNFIVEENSEMSGYRIKCAKSTKVQEIDESLICPCVVAVCFGLCCRHVFAVQKYKNDSLFLPHLIHKRWKTKILSPDVTYLLNNENNPELTQNRFDAVMKECEDFSRWLSTRSDKDFDANFQKFVDFKNRLMGSQSSDDHDYSRSQIETILPCNAAVLPESIVYIQVEQGEISELIETTSMETVYT